MDELIAMGFDEASSQAALRRMGGNLDQAIDFLLSNAREPNSASSNQPSSSVSGRGVLISLGISQYTFGESGASACTVIAGSMLKLLLSRLKEGSMVTEVAELSEVVWTGVSHYQALPPEMHSHLAIDELGLFMTEKLVNNGTLQGLLTTRNHFEDLFTQARACSSSTEHIGIVITKPPETVCVILPPATCSDEKLNKFILFDSHSRPQLGLSGSYLFVSEDQGEVIRRLQGLFPPLPMERGGAADYMQQMYNMFDGSVFQYK